MLVIGKGDEVISTALTAEPTNTTISLTGAKIIWADVDPLSGTLDPESVRKKVTNKTKLIVHNHFCGYPGHIDEINLIGKEYGIPVFDDGIECFGSEYNGKKIGVTGADATLFSFNPVRLPTTIDGGAVIFKARHYMIKVY